jgi:D-xylono/L-arabinono-1,4-lactonase
MVPQPEIIADYACKTGEGPIWHAAEGRLYWTDIPNGRLFRFDPASGHHEQVYQGRPVGGMTVQADGALLLFMDRGTVATWRDGEIEILLDEIPGEEGNRFNDVIADPEGRVFCGTMGMNGGPGNLYRLDSDLSFRVVVEGTRTSNGMGFSLDLTRMYFTDSGLRTIDLFDYDRASGQIANRRGFVAVSGEGEGGPDGMTVDAEGCIWSTRWGGSCAVRYSPEGEELERVPFPTPKVSCPAFGGPQLRDLYCTTAGGDDKAGNGELAGALFRFQPAVGGRPEFLSRIGL